MFKSSSFRLILFTAAFTLAAMVLTPSPGRAEGIAARLPPGFYLVSSAPGVDLYQKDYPNGSPDYVQVIDLSLGAKVVVLHGQVISTGQNKGAYGGDNATFQRKTILQFWKEFTQTVEQPFCVTNGQFFRMADSPSPLPFPLKKDGQLLTDGYALREFPEKKFMLELWPDQTDIVELSKENLYNSTAPDIVAGLREDAEKAKTKSVGRTFIGVDDQDLDGTFELLLIFNSRSAKPQDAAETLRSFGSDKVMMLDGGGSTQLICQGNVLINTDRQIPQVLGVSAAPPIDFSAKIIFQNPFQVLSQGDKIILNFTVENRGLKTWPADQTAIKIDASNLRLNETVSITQDIAPGSNTSLEFPLEGINDVGIQKIVLSVVWNNNRTLSEPQSAQIIVLPLALSARKQELQDKLIAWSSLPEDQLKGQVSDWINSSMSNLQPIKKDLLSNTPRNTESRSLDLTYSLLVPATMLPAVFLILLIVKKRQRVDDFDIYGNDF